MPGAPRPFTWAPWPCAPDGGPVLVVGVEKMWTGDRGATIAGIEDGLPADYRADMHARFRAEDTPGGSVLMSLNDFWARQCMEERGTTVEQIAAAAVKARRNAACNPLAQVQQSVTLDEVLAAPQVAGVLTRLMCSSFTDGAAAVVLGPSAATAAAPRIIGSMARSGDGSLDYHDRLGEVARGGLGASSGADRAISTWSSCTTPPAQRRSTPWSRWA